MNKPKLVFEKSIPGKQAWFLPASDVPEYPVTKFLNSGYLNDNPRRLPELSEIDVVRHYTNLSTRNHGVDSGFYPLGSCTMKYNPKINEDIARFTEFLSQHPLNPTALSQGTLAVLYQLEESLKEITGMDYFTLQPAAGAHGELTALLIIKKYLLTIGQPARVKILIPTSAHGTNPASASMAGFETVSVNCNSSGLIDIDHLKSLLNPEVAAIMLTNPNTLGLFEKDISEIANLVHQSGALLYYDGANLNAIMGLIRPGDMGFDLVHLNLHKTFSTPHGGGGPGAGPVGVKSFLKKFLPVPVLEKTADSYYWNSALPDSIGKISGFYGNFSVILKALAYIRALGGPGLAQVSRDAILNANYLRVCLAHIFHIPYNQPCMHEFVLSATQYKKYQIKALDIAKRMLDFDIHPPTIYFPLIVEEAMMIEPTETEDKSTLDSFINILTQISEEAINSPEYILSAPHHTPVNRLDETLAARSPKLRWHP